MKLTLITGRTIGQGRSVEDKLAGKYRDAVSTVFLDKSDMEKLGVKEGDRVKVSTSTGEAILRVSASRFSQQGIAFIPMGPYANLLLPYETEGSGMPCLKNVEAEVAKATGEILDVQGILQVYGVQGTITPEDYKPADGKSYTVEDAVCSFCGCLCDDLTVKVENGVIARVEKACSIGRAKLENHWRGRLLKPYVRQDGVMKPVSLEEALEKAAEILTNSNYPLLYGWSNTTVQAMRVGYELAELLGGVIDNTTSVCHGPTILGVMNVGTVRATLGQLRNQADLLVYWGCNPLEAHQRQYERYGATSKGFKIKSRSDRKVVVVDVRETLTARTADLHLRVQPGGDYNLITALRMAIRDYEIERDQVAGVPVEEIYKLADVMRSCRFGVLYFGVGATMTTGKELLIEALVRLVQDLNEWTKFALQPLRGHYNVSGACQTSLWTTGYAFGVDYMRGYPRHNASITTAVELLANRDVDAALIIASDPVAHFPAEAVRGLLEIPVIAIDSKVSLTVASSTVAIPSALSGVEVEGTAYRMDGVALHLKKIVQPPPQVLGDEEILKRLLEKVRSGR